MIPRRESRAFTLIELIASMLVLVLIVLLVSQLVGSAQRTAINGDRRMDAEGQARLVLDRLGADLSCLVNRPDADFTFVKLTGNDKMFFYSSAPGYFAGTAAATGSTAGSQSDLTLVGYQINSAFQLERLGMSLSWDAIPDESAIANAASSNPPPAPTPGGPAFLTFSTTGSFLPDSLSTLPGRWPKTLGTSATDPPFQGRDSTNDKDFQVIGDGIVRLEFCVLLKPVYLNTGVYQPGNYSYIPCAAPNDGRQNNLTATVAPTVNDTNYLAGSRWYDTKNCRAYQCTSILGGPGTGLPATAVWKPLGMTDVAAIVATIAYLDPVTRNIATAYSGLVPGTTGSRVSPGAELIDPVSSDAFGSVGTLPAQSWQATINNPAGLQQAGLPPIISQRLHVYQRTIYLPPAQP